MGFPAAPLPGDGLAVDVDGHALVLGRELGHQLVEARRALFRLERLAGIAGVLEHVGLHHAGREQRHDDPATLQVIAHGAHAHVHGGLAHLVVVEAGHAAHQRQ